VDIHLFKIIYVGCKLFMN